MVKFHVVMSLEQSLTIFVTHFVKYLRLVSRGKQSFFGGGGGRERFTVGGGREACKNVYRRKENREKRGRKIKREISPHCVNFVMNLPLQSFESVNLIGSFTVFYRVDQEQLYPWFFLHVSVHIARCLKP